MRQITRFATATLTAVALSAAALTVKPALASGQQCFVNPVTGFAMPFQRCFGFDVMGHAYGSCNPILKHISPCNPTGR